MDLTEVAMVQAITEEMDLTEVAVVQAIMEEMVLTAVEVGPTETLTQAVLIAAVTALETIALDNVHADPPRLQQTLRRLALCSVAGIRYCFLLRAAPKKVLTLTYSAMLPVYRST